MQDILEVGGGIEETVELHAAMAAGLPRSWYTSFRNGQPIRHFPTFEQAMRYWWPEWQPQGNGYEAGLDNI